MDWIERWFNVSPDNGDGSLELLIFLALVAVAVTLALATRPQLRARVRRWLGARPSRRTPS